MNTENIKSILIVDDSGTARMIIKQCLEIAGLFGKDFYEAKNGQDALQIIQEYGPELLVTDLNMPVMDGRALLEQLKSLTSEIKISVIVISSSSNQAKEQELLGLGADVVLNKPISPAGILTALNKLN